MPRRSGRIPLTFNLKYMSLPLVNEVKMVDGLILKLCPECLDFISESDITEEHGNPTRYLFHKECYDRMLNEKIANDQIETLEINEE